MKASFWDFLGLNCYDLFKKVLSLLLGFIINMRFCNNPKYSSYVFLLGTKTGIPLCFHKASLAQLARVGFELGILGQQVVMGRL